MYDLIGDIHGHATELKLLLDKLGYRERNGTWQHPERNVIFLGDFIDRGPEQEEVVAISRSMVESGNALAIMGNHEFNAVAWATPHPTEPDEYLREHSQKNHKQHRAFLDAVGEGSQKHRDIIEWFKTLPVYLQLPEFRAVHACWHPQQIDALAPWMDGAQRIKPDAWPEVTTKGTNAFEAAEVLMKGLEVPLPPGSEFRDKDGHPRHDIRARWWDLEGLSYRDLAMVPVEALDDIPHRPIPDDILPGYDGKKPVFVGHYWLKGTPEPLNEHIACLDYSVVDPSGGKLCAYRWDGRPLLSAQNLIWIER